MTTNKKASPRKPAVTGSTVTSRVASHRGGPLRPAPKITAAEPLVALPPNQTQREFYDAVHSNVADNLLARRMAEEIPAKLEYNRTHAGRSGWQGQFCTTSDLEDSLKELIRKKDWLDVAIVAGMLLVRKDLYNE